MRSHGWLVDRKRNDKHITYTDVIIDVFTYWEYCGSVCFYALIVVGINNCGSRTFAGLLLGYTTLFDVLLTDSM